MIEPLLTSPAPDAAIVFGKASRGCLSGVRCGFPHCCLYTSPASLDPSTSEPAASYVGVVNIGVYYIGIGLLMSTVSRNQLVAACCPSYWECCSWSECFVLSWSKARVFEYVSIWDHMGTATRESSIREVLFMG